MIGLTCAVVLILIGIIFRSAFVPLRLVVTILMSVSWVFGSVAQFPPLLRTFRADSLPSLCVCAAAVTAGWLS